jgi:hypothetical protein
MKMIKIGGLPMNGYTAMVIMNLGILALTGVVFWITNSWWSLIILLFLFSEDK